MGETSAKMECGDCPIRHRAVCARCDADELKLLEDMKYYRTYEAGQPIAWAGDEMSFVGSVVRGTAAISQTLEDGRTQMVGLLLPSDFLGRPGRPTSPFDIRAVDEVMLCCFRRRPFEQMLAATPHVVGRLLDMTLDELDAAREWMLILGRKTAREKIASLLSILARRESSIDMVHLTGPVRIKLPLTREAMADYLGLTLETVSRQISALKRDKIIILADRRVIVVPDIEKLVAQSGGDQPSSIGY
ncbi:MAG: Crp/Fnr family transcriptional regulator [Rhodobacteraceae bacterium]|nr:Crp/Fnr family transcriptional regulator [Paracoccaceae bacterium]